MHEKQINKFIGYGITLIIAYYIVGAFIPVLTWTVIGLVVWRIYREHRNFK